MTDDELFARLKASAPESAEASDPQFWDRFHRDLDAALARPMRRRLLRPAFALGLATAAAALLLALRIHRPARTGAPLPAAALPAGVIDELAGTEDPCELIGDLDSDELEAVAHHLKPGA